MREGGFAIAARAGGPETAWQLSSRVVSKMVRLLENLN
jgi:hypothetical protein